MKKPFHVAQFKIRPDRKGRWQRKGGIFLVLVLRDIRAVRKLYGPGAGDLAAYVRAFQAGPYLGTIVLPASVGNGMLAHEATHAAFNFVSWQMTGKTYGRRVDLFGNEQICLAVGNIVAEITNGLYRKGVWK